MAGKTSMVFAIFEIVLDEPIGSVSSVIAW